MTTLSSRPRSPSLRLIYGKTVSVEILLSIGKDDVARENCTSCCTSRVRDGCSRKRALCTSSCASACSRVASPPDERVASSRFGQREPVNSQVRLAPLAPTPRPFTRRAPRFSPIPRVYPSRAARR